MLVNSVLLKDKKPGLKEFSKNWFKGKEGKARKKEADADGDGTWMLDMYEAYLAQQAKWGIAINRIFIILHTFY